MEIKIFYPIIILLYGGFIGTIIRRQLHLFLLDEFGDDKCVKLQAVIPFFIICLCFAIYIAQGFTPSFFFNSLLGVVLCVIAVVDGYYTYIYDFHIMQGFILLAMQALWEGSYTMILNTIVVFSFVWFFTSIYNYFVKEAFASGDLLLSALIGAAVGFEGFVEVLKITLVLLIVCMILKRASLRTQWSLGPYMVTAMGIWLLVK